MLKSDTLSSFIFFFFFSSRRRHTRFKCDWSSDVCSSDLCSFPSTLPRARTHGNEQRNESHGSCTNYFLRFLLKPPAALWEQGAVWSNRNGTIFGRTTGVSLRWIK